jgi:hypothetical protein
MKRTLSILKDFYRTLCWAGNGCRSFWNVSLRFYFSPTEKNLLIGYWYDYHHFCRVVPEGGIDVFLDTRVRGLKVKSIHRLRSARYRQLSSELVNALCSEKILVQFVTYVQSPSPKENCEPLINALLGAWRNCKEFDDPETEQSKQPPGQVEPKPVESEIEWVMSGKGAVGMLNAKAYYIGAELYYELRGEEKKFEQLSWDLVQLRHFIGSQFKIWQLPGTFEELKGYSYKTALTKKPAIRGQLRPPLRQIAKNPEVFGSEVSARAGAILDKFLK